MSKPTTSADLKKEDSAYFEQEDSPDILFPTPRRSLETFTTAEEVTPEKDLDFLQTFTEQGKLPEEVLSVGKIEVQKSARDIFVSRISMPEGIKLLDIADSDEFHIRSIIASDTTLPQFNQFLDINCFSRKESNLFYWASGTIYMKDFDTESMDSNQTRIHGNAIAYFTSAFSYWSVSLDTHDHFLSYMSDVTTANAAVSISPDVVFTLNDRDRVAIEICYATSFQDAHARMLDEYNAMPNMKAGIVIKIAYPIQNEDDDTFPEGIKYTVNDGAYVAVFYERPRDGEELEVVRAISFGDTPLPTNFRNRITLLTGLEAVEGYLETDVNACDAAALDSYIYQLPARALLLVNESDQHTITGHAVNQIPAEINLTMDLFRLKQHIRTGIRQTNLLVFDGAENVVLAKHTLC